MTPIEQIQRQYGVVGRERELAAGLAALSSGRHLLLEGPVGCGKTKLALAVCGHLGRETVRVDGDERSSESRLAGWFDPPLVLARGYSQDSFVAGPLVRALREGRVLFLNELNRLPDAAQNLLLPALDEGVVLVPHLGAVQAAPGFQVVATQNPAEYVATGQLSEALRDRFEHLGLGYQSAGEEEAIVAAVTGCADRELVRAAVRLVRATRSHPDLRRGASVRAAVAVVTLAARSGGDRRESLQRAALTALPTRIDVREAGTDLAELVPGLVDEALIGGGGDGRRVPRAASRPLRAPVAEEAGEEPRGRLREREPEAVSCTLADRRALAQHLRAAPDDLDGWRLAGDLSAGVLDHAGERAYLCAQQLAAGAVLRRAARLVGPLRAATRTVREPLREPWGGELDVEATVENLVGKAFPEPGDWVVQRRVDRRHQVVLMVDTSLSMSGENMAIAATAAAVLALKLHPEDLSVVVFEDKAVAATHLDVPDPPAEVVRRMLDQPVRGYTNIEAALELGAAELERGRSPRRSGLLITDGVVTAGGDPRPLAHRFPHLFVLLTEDYKMNPELCRELADAGHGDVFPVRDFAALPARLLDVANRVLR